MKTIGNILWVILGGFLVALGMFIVGLLLCITIIGIPAGKQIFKLANFCLLPFGKEADTNFESHIIGNIIWLIIVGWENFLTSIFFGVIFTITIIGIPFGRQWFKIGVVMLMPFGTKFKAYNKKK